ncbi:exonuclease domain-containing protein [Actinophytocola oryzae]|uniref:Exodeoxyribonuclease X n=1 Tax=Actinophytocola oryzae TaxID=502181 RepID=A0A4R7VX05_9PSEU|nr:exonuclease domain-containing protein [Actinophytocola oryzae]TDV54178.1 exodeoxyribonuclease X [Actinophytocola oryzae]
MTDWTTLDYVVVDVEGHGHQPPDLVELAAVPIVAGSVGEPKSWLVKPDQPITHFARKVHGISNEQVADAPMFAYVEADVRNALDASALIAHNAHVDIGVLQRKLGDWECPEVFDTLKLARRLLPGRTSYKLDSLVADFNLSHGLDTTDGPHRATYDALVTARLFVHLAGQRSLGELRDHPPGGGPDNEPRLF